MPRAILFVALLAIALAGQAPTIARADSGLTEAVAATYVPRYEDTELHAIAHERVAQLAACDCLSHDGMQAGTAEVIAYNSGFPNPIASAVEQWKGSPPHDDILSNPEYGRIGCAELVADGTHWFACVLTWGALPPAPTPPPQGGGTILLPNTALPNGG
ncbi:MAG TPA: CAP domain-containing protein [Candidatus Limnocylindria bacterium]